MTTKPHRSAGTDDRAPADLDALFAFLEDEEFWSKVPPIPQPEAATKPAA